MAIPNVAARPAKNAKKMIATTTARSSCRRNAGVKRSAAQFRPRGQYRLGRLDPESPPMVPSVLRGTCWRPITFARAARKPLQPADLPARVRAVDRVVLLEASGAKHLVILDRDMLTVPSIGVVRADVLRASIGRRWSIGGRAYLVLTPSIRDHIGSLRRGPQIVGPKDVGALVWNCDIKAGGGDRDEGPSALWPLRFLLAKRRAGEPHGRSAARRDVRGDPHGRDHRAGDRVLRVRDPSVLRPAGPHGVPDLRAQRPRDALTVEARREHGGPLIPPSLPRTESAGRLGGPAA